MMILIFCYDGNRVNECQGIMVSLQQGRQWTGRSLSGQVGASVVTEAITAKATGTTTGTAVAGANTVRGNLTGTITGSTTGTETRRRIPRVCPTRTDPSLFAYPPPTICNNSPKMTKSRYKFFHRLADTRCIRGVCDQSGCAWYQNLLLEILDYFLFCVNKIVEKSRFTAQLTHWQGSCASECSHIPRRLPMEMAESVCIYYGLTFK